MMSPADAKVNSDEDYASADGSSEDSDFVSRMLSSDSVFSFVDSISARFMEKVSISDMRYIQPFNRKHVNSSLHKIIGLKYK